MLGLCDLQARTSKGRTVHRSCSSSTTGARTRTRCTGNALQKHKGGKGGKIRQGTWPRVSQVSGCCAGSTDKETTKARSNGSRSVCLLSWLSSKCNHKNSHVLFMKCSITMLPAQQMQPQKLSCIVFEVFNCYAGGIANATTKTRKYNFRSAQLL